MNITHNDDNYIELFKAIDNIYSNGVFNNFIDRIIFPFFKNFEQDSEIKFTFPFTVLVGKNGCGKSSCLHALYGCPRNKSTGDFWFSTNLDPIKESGGKVNSYIYEYTENREKRSAYKARTKRSKGVKHRENLDYWETRIISKKLEKKYNLQTSSGSGRDKPIHKNIIYLDFRSELSAFDQFFYFGTLGKNLASNSKQDYLRVQSVKLSNVFEKSKVINVNGAKQNEMVIHLSDTVLNIISYILGKNYNSGKIITHKLFGSWGTSILLENNNFKYSEAHAGSGEIAIVKLVYTLLNSTSQSLVLLDEPEVSLHPGAQRRLKIFLLELIKQKKHQVIISTHSPNFVEKLPRKAIKLFSFNPDTEKVKVIPDCLPEEAFYSLGHTFNAYVCLIVEDKLAKSILKELINTLGEEKSALFDVAFYPGGAQTIKNSHVKHYAITEVYSKFFIFDGDQKPDIQVLDISNIQRKDFNVKFLESHIKSITKNSRIKFDCDGSHTSGARTDQLLNSQEKFIQFYKENVYYFPTDIPEEIIWNEGIIFSLIQDEKTIKEIQSENSLKNKLKISANVLFPGVTDPVEALEGLLIRKWLDLKSAEKDYLLNTLSDIIKKIERESFSSSRRIIIN